MSVQPARSREVTPQPGLARRAGLVLWFPFGLVLSAVRYLRGIRAVRRSESPGDVTDLPPALEPDVVDDDLKTLDDGAGRLLHRSFRIHVLDSGLTPAELITVVTGDLDRAAPSEVVSFRKHRGRLGELELGDEYRVRMPAPWDGPVRVVHRDPTSFRFATLAGHLEAGQIEFRASGAGRGLTFEIESWSRSGDRLARVAFDRLHVGQEIQLHMWTQFCLRVGQLTGGRRDGPVSADTRRSPWPPPAAPSH